VNWVQNVQAVQPPSFILPRVQTVSQCYKSLGCHAERERSICFSNGLRKADSSAVPQNDILTSLVAGEERGEGCNDWNVWNNWNK
jgi:hypothetical protein